MTTSLSKYDAQQLLYWMLKDNTHYQERLTSFDSFDVGDNMTVINSTMFNYQVDSNNVLLAQGYTIILSHDQDRVVHAINGYLVTRTVLYGDKNRHIKTERTLIEKSSY